MVAIDGLTCRFEPYSLRQSNLTKGKRMSSKTTLRIITFCFVCQIVLLILAIALWIFTPVSHLFTVLVCLFFIALDGAFIYLKKNERKGND